MDTTPTMTLDEFVEAAERALVDVEIHDGRVAERVDRRAVRYYTTLGLLDRPTPSGRRVLYAETHLAQLVAVKVLQARGFSLAEIRAALTGLDPDAIAGRVAQISDRTPNPAWRRRPAGTGTGTVLVVAPHVRVVFDTEIDPDTAARVRAALVPVVSDIESSATPATHRSRRAHHEGARP